MYLYMYLDNYSSMSDLAIYIPIYLYTCLPVYTRIMTRAVYSSYLEL